MWIVIILLVGIATLAFVRKVRLGMTSESGESPPPTMPPPTVSLTAGMPPPSPVVATGPSAVSTVAAYLHSLHAPLQRWTDAGIITTDQASRVVEHERQLVTSTLTSAVPGPNVPARRSRISPIAETLGYLGAVLVLSGMVPLAARNWTDLGRSGQILVALAVVLVGTFSGRRFDDDSDSAFVRLRTALWSLASVGVAGSVGLIGDAIADVDGRGFGYVAAASFAAVSAHAAWLWGNRARPVQQFITILSALAAVGALAGTASRSFLVSGLALAICGVLLLRASLVKRFTNAELTAFLGAAATGLGGLLLGGWETPIGMWGGSAIMLTLLWSSWTTRGLLPDSHRVGAALFGGGGSLLLLPTLVGFYLPGAAVAVSLAVVAAGAALVLWGARVLRAPVLIQLAGSCLALAGAALSTTGLGSAGTLLGCATAAVLLSIGTRPGRFACSVTGSAGLVVFIPWAIGVFFPGQGRASLVVASSGLLLVGLAVYLARRRPR
jgi:hypothetical protein